ncbi:hypothetical protein D5S18_18515 [Nocardia panacis]|uniref:Helix-turn-helix DNA binding domain protein n=1 Tax=Nocardia panacis TaxID=2340916 RepID=A0A3A4K2L1_9NOCA|nr:hypothetical protein D5S18_18515 [Nocardia panacis]
MLCRIWQDKDFRALPRTAQALYVQLVSQPNINNAGVVPLMLSKWAKGCDELTSDRIIADLAALIDGRFVVVDSDTEEVLVRSFIRNDGVLKQPNVLKNALRCAEAVESHAIREALAAELRRTGRNDAARTADILSPSETRSGDTANPSETLQEGFEHPSVTLPRHAQENPRSNPSETLPEPRTLRKPFADPSGVGEGVGEGENSSYVVGHLGGVARADTRAARAHAREDTPTPENPPSEEPPSPNCPRHPEGTTEPCGHCADARKRRERFHAEQAERVNAARAEEIRRTAEVRRAAIDACAICDADGYAGGRVCDHDPGTAARARRGIEAVRAALAAKRAETATPTPEPEEAPKRPPRATQATGNSAADTANDREEPDVA